MRRWVIRRIFTAVTRVHQAPLHSLLSPDLRTHVAARASHAHAVARPRSAMETTVAG